MPEPGNGPVFHVEPRGRLGNQMIQYMVALKFQSLVPGSRISNVRLPEWRIDHPPLPRAAPVAYAAQQQKIDLAGLAEQARAGEIRSVVWSGFGQRMENFLDADFYRAVFRPVIAATPHFDKQYLVCPVRAEDVLEASADHPYPLTPVEFYADVVAETGLIPVFMGQTAPNAYTDRLRARFPQAQFLHTGDPMQDFAIIRSAANILLGVSTFGWLAAWLSRADRIFMAASGLFHPMQERMVNLLPFGDPRYRFYLFPLNHGVPLRQHAAAHRRIAPYWRFMPQEVLQRLLREAPRFDPPVEQMLERLDPAYYLAANPDIATALRADGIDEIHSHYRSHGMAEGRQPFRFASAWYAERHPAAALEVAQGDYSSLTHHYVAVGRERGYRRFPDDEGEPVRAPMPATERDV